MEENVRRYPAPWNLRGKGYIFIYSFKREFIEREGRVPEFLKGRFAGGFGSVMLVDYEDSNVGAYGEYLFIPGRFKYGGKRLNTISRIFVSTRESVVNGRKNWGIPKEKADFRFEKLSGAEESVTVSNGKDKIAEYRLKAFGPGFPVSTKLLPFPLVQRYEGRTYFTDFHGKGRGRFCRIESVKIDPRFFPDVSQIRPIAVIRVEPFDIVFPEAEIETDGRE